MLRCTFSNAQKTISSGLLRVGGRRFARPVLARQAHSQALAAAIPQSHRRQQQSSWGRKMYAAAGAAGALAILGADLWLNKADACGIVGYVGDMPATTFLLEGLHILQNRGYDSAGIATVTASGELVTSKFASRGSTSDSIDLLKEEAPKVHGKDSSGIAHTRWATHGGKTDQNAHPHSDQKNRIALVHNGTIENYAELKAELQKYGVTFKSQTDSEVIAQLVGFYLDQDMAPLAAVKKTLSRLEGTWGLAIMHKDAPDQIIAARNGSPLVIGIGTDCMFVASEVSAFSRQTTQYIALKDGEVAVVRSKGHEMDLSRVEEAHKEEILMSPDPYPHWTIKEIYDQPAAIARTMGYGGRFTEAGLVKLGGLDDNKARLLGVQNLVFAACGTSLFASMYGAQLFRDLSCFNTANTIDAAEVVPESFPRSQGGVIVVSQSGETKDTHRAAVASQDMHLPVISVVNQVGSLIARTTGCGVYLNAGREHAVASTKAFTTQVTAMALMGGWFAQNRTDADQAKRELLMDAVHRLPIYAGIALKSHQRCREIAARLVAKKPQHMFVLGKGYSEPIAKETALKIKEITYIHAEGFGGGALKHGPFALLEEGTPVILFIMNDRHAELMRIAAAEVHARGAFNIIITDKPELAAGVADEVLVVPSNGPLTALVATIPAQLLAYEISVAKGINPDKPKNLAKAVTVD